MITYRKKGKMNKRYLVQMWEIVDERYSSWYSLNHTNYKLCSYKASPLSIALFPQGAKT